MSVCKYEGADVNQEMINLWGYIEECKKFYELQLKKC